MDFRSKRAGTSLRRGIGAAALATCTLMTIAYAQQPADTARGQRLYDAVCVHCHTQSVHNRTPRAARSFEDVRSYVKRWSQAAGQQWTADDVYDVTAFLNERFYGFKCDREDCRQEVTRREGHERQTKVVTTAK